MTLSAHHQLFNRYLFKGTIELVTALHISSGRASDTTDAPFIRLLNEIPYIPGSSLRGAIRSELERFIKVVGSDAGLNTCILYSESEDECSRKIKKFLEDGKKTNQDLFDFAEGELCDICKLFGSTIYASRLVFEDALPAEPNRIENSTRIRDGVGIDRDTGAAKVGVKFNYEVIEPGPCFNFTMLGENLQPQDKKIVDLILFILKGGLVVGGKRAGGLGHIKLKEEYSVTGFEDPKTLYDTLVAGGPILQPIAWKEGFNAKA